jgi:histidine triad (HIT) family protein
VGIGRDAPGAPHAIGEVDSAGVAWRTIDAAEDGPQSVRHLVEVPPRSECGCGSITGRHFGTEPRDGWGWCGPSNRLFISRPSGVGVAATVAPVEGCSFCRIIAGTHTSHRVLDTPAAVAFLDIRPLFKGHTLVVPRDHHETLLDLPADAVGPYFTEVQRVSRAMEAALGAAGSFVAMNNRISQSVPHLHVHVVPRNPKDGLKGFFWPRTRYDDESDAVAHAARLRTALA